MSANLRLLSRDSSKTTWSINHDKLQAVQSLLNELPGHLSPNKNKQLNQFYCKQCDAGFVLENGLTDHLESMKHKSN